MRKIYYKVVDENRRSLTHFLDAKDKFSLLYLKGETVRPKLAGSKIFIFKTRKDAKAFLASADDWNKILRVHANGVKEILSAAMFGHDVVSFWEKPIRTVYELSPPQGTLGADEVTVLD